MGQRPPSAALPSSLNSLCATPPSQFWVLPHCSNHGSCPGPPGEYACLATPPGPPWSSAPSTLLPEDTQEQGTWWLAAAQQLPLVAISNREADKLWRLLIQGTATPSPLFWQKRFAGCLESQSLPIDTVQAGDRHHGLTEEVLKWILISLRYLLNVRSSLLAEDVPRVIPTNLSSVTSAHFRMSPLISHCLQHLSILALLCLTQEHLSSDSFAFSFPSLPDCLSVRLTPHPWLPPLFPGSPRMAKDVIWRAVHVCSLITGNFHNHPRIMKTVITVYKGTTPARLVKSDLALLSKRPRGKSCGCSIISLPALLWTVQESPELCPCVPSGTPVFISSYAAWTRVRRLQRNSVIRDYSECTFGVQSSTGKPRSGQRHILTQRIYDLSFRMSFYSLALARGVLNSRVLFSMAAPVPRQTGCRLEGDTAQFRLSFSCWWPKPFASSNDQTYSLLQERDYLFLSDSGTQKIGAVTNLLTNWRVWVLFL